MSRGVVRGLLRKTPPHRSWGPTPEPVSAGARGRPSSAKTADEGVERPLLADGGVGAVTGNDQRVVV